MRFPYHKQEKPDTCGAACMRMALERFGIVKSEREIEELMDLNDMPFHDDFAGVAERFKLSYIVKRNSNIKELKSLLRQGYVIILCHFVPEAGIDHYSVLKKIDSKSIHFYDPYRGPKQKLSLKHFKSNWMSNPRDDDEKRWFIAIKR